MLNNPQPDFSKNGGLLPTIIVDNNTQQVLTLAYMNQESFEKTLETQQTWFYSRSRQTLWHKGETSGHTQQVVSLTLDCDQDTLLVKVIPNGPACHTGSTSCFNQSIPIKKESKKMAQQTLSELYDLVRSRKENPIEGSYTDYLFNKGLDKILKKVGEENTEVIIGAKNTNDELIFETADYLYHLMVLLVAKDIPLSAIEAELGSRLDQQSRLHERPNIDNL